MPIARITKLEPTGQFESQYGPLFKFVVYLDDNNYGTTNAKSNNPWYKVGTEVSYEVSGNFKGTPTFKIGKPDSAAPQRSVAPAPVQSDVSHAPTIQTSPINGASVGMAIKMAMDILLDGLTRDEKIARLQEPSFWASVMELSSDILRVARHIESGHLAPSIKDRISGYTAPVAPQPKPVVTATRPQPGPGGSVHLNPEADLDSVPF